MASEARTSPWAAAAVSALVAGALGLIAGALLGPRWVGRAGPPTPPAPAPAESTDTGESDEATPAPGKPGAAGETRVIRPGPLPEPYSTRLDAFPFDVDGDGAEETVELFAAVVRDARGRLVWDDGQRWMLRVREGGGESAAGGAAGEGYLLFDDFVQLGQLSYRVIARPGETPDLVLELATGAGVRVWSLRHDAARGGFVEASSVEASGNVVHRSPAEPE